MALELEQSTRPAAFDASVIAEGNTLPVDGLYVHVPFCFHKCHYCDFYSITRQTPERMARFVDLVLREAEAWTSRRPELATAGAIRTVFFGGGTPSLLPAGEMARLIGGLRERLDFSAVGEFTVECNPATVDAAYLGGLRAAGVDRLSFGAQSFNPADLRVLERHHDPEDVPRSLEFARSAGFRRLNLDLIYGVPGQSLADWDHSLRQGLACGTGHVSAYLLTYEANTPIAVKKRLGQLVAAEESLELEMLAYTRSQLAEFGLPAYEISNFAQPGQECGHNVMYWRGGSYLGLGPSAASHVHGWRWKNRGHLGEWERAVEAGTLPIAEGELLSAARRQAEKAYLGVRTTAGVAWADIGPCGRERFEPVLARLVRAGLVLMDEGGFRLTEAGVKVSDGVGSELLTAAEVAAR